MTEELPKFCEILDQIIREIATENGEDPDNLKESLLVKTRKDEVGTATVPTSANSEHPPTKEVFVQ
jgi:hypothetical protein